MKLRVVVELTELEAEALAWAAALVPPTSTDVRHWQALQRARSKLDIARRQAEHELEDWTTK